MKKHIALLFVAFSMLASPLVAQEAVKEEVKKTSESETKTSEESKTESDKKTEDEEDEEEKKSSDGSYEWKRSFGFGFELGYWFSDFERWEICDNRRGTTFSEDCYLIKSNTTLKSDYSSVFNGDLFLEASLLEGTRLSLFGGIQSPFAEDPSIKALYVGIEPAFAFRSEMWEIALGVGVGFGSANLEHSTGEKMDASLTLMRPFIELRRYLNTWSAVYGRVGFNQWLISDPEFEQIALKSSVTENNLNLGGLWMSVGLRFGSYPLHEKKVGDSDGDGIKDDVDDCPDEAEDMDKFQDADGCPESDNDGDGILDAVDKCPLQAEDKDGYMDEDGCPEEDDDSDGDGILNSVDKCQNDAEDMDGFEDTDGCPDTDNDKDSILDAVDKCPNEAEVINGVEDEDGCPDKGKSKVKITETKIEILEKVFFATGKASIKKRSFGLLNQVAAVLKAYPKMTKIRVEGHTDDRGKDQANLKLSEARAKSVVDYLVGQGVAAERLVSKGYGETKPIEPNKTRAGRGANRRVEFTIIEVEGKPMEGKSAVIKEEVTVEEGK